MAIEIVQADYRNPQHRRDIPHLLDIYARDPMGGGAPLPAAVRQNLVDALAALPHAFSVLAYVDGQPAGLVNCFQTLSTFHCAPLVNIHDVVVVRAHRGQGISHRLLAEVERIARERKCCKLTLEVLSGNDAAQASYRKFGFSDYTLSADTGAALFWQKSL